MADITIDWAASWTDDTTMGATITDTSSDDSAEYSNDAGLVHEFACDFDYGATYDGPALVHVLRKLSTADYEETENAYAVFAVIGAISTAGRKVFTVGPEVNTFMLRIVNDSGATVTVDLDYKTGKIVSA